MEGLSSKEEAGTASPKKIVVLRGSGYNVKWSCAGLEIGRDGVVE